MSDNPYEAPQTTPAQEHDSGVDLKRLATLQVVALAALAGCTILGVFIERPTLLWNYIFLCLGIAGSAACCIWARKSQDKAFFTISVIFLIVDGYLCWSSESLMLMR